MLDAININTGLVRWY